MLHKIWQKPSALLYKGATTKHLWRKTKVNFGNYNIVKPGVVFARNSVPSHIKTPSYYESGVPSNSPSSSEVKSKDQIIKMRASCKLAANVLKEVGNCIKVGQTTDEIDRFVHDLVIKNGAYPSPLNYKLFPKSVCTSVNNVACHGIPDDRPLESGDIINVDVTVFLNGYHGDCSKTFLVGDVDEQGRMIVESTETCLNEAIAICKPDENFNRLGAIIEKRAKRLGFSVIPVFAGHGIGEYFHGPPDIFHCKNHYHGTMKAGMTFTIEPILTQGRIEIEILQDNWTAVTFDNSRTAQFEHTVLITSQGVEILTIPD